MKGENGTPVTPDWSPEPRCCPFKDCPVCESAQHHVFLHLADNIIVGDN